jgi:hypothetical protein
MAKRRALTDLGVQKLPLPAKGQKDHFDPNYPGLVLRASHGGRKTWAFVYRIGKRQRRMTLGMYPVMGLAEARQVWREARSESEAGRDPSRASERAATDVAGVVEEWLRRDQAKNRSAAQTARKVRRHILPPWGHRPITDIKRRDVLDLIDGIVTASFASCCLRVRCDAALALGGSVSPATLATMRRASSRVSLRR